MALLNKNYASLDAGGEKRTFWFGMGAIGLYLDNVRAQGITLDTLIDRMQENPFSVVPKLMYFSYAYGFIREGKEKDIDANMYQVSEWIDQDGGINGFLFSEFMRLFTISLSDGTETTEKGPRTTPAKKKRVKAKK